MLQMPRRVPGEPYTRITSPEASEMLGRGDGVIIDVRRPDEFELGHPPGALPLPVDELLARHEELLASGQLLFICEVGVRSGLACEYAASLGVEQDRLFNVEDGMQGWLVQGLPVSRGAEE